MQSLVPGCAGDPGRARTGEEVRPAIAGPVAKAITGLAVKARVPFNRGGMMAHALPWDPVARQERRKRAGSPVKGARAWESPKARAEAEKRDPAGPGDGKK